MRSLRLRIVLAVLGALALAVVLHAAVVTRELASVLVHGLVSVFEPVRDQDLDACEAAPATWFLAAGRWTAHAYDPETLLSANPGAPPLDPALRSNLRWTSDGRAMRLVGLGFAGDAAVARPTDGETPHFEVGGPRRLRRHDMKTETFRHICMARRKDGAG
jgi:hypothetical protein